MGRCIIITIIDVVVAGMAEKVGSYPPDYYIDRSTIITLIHINVIFNLLPSTSYTYVGANIHIFLIDVCYHFKRFINFNIFRNIITRQYLHMTIQRFIYIVAGSNQ